MQSISKQIKRLENVIDGLYNRSESMLGTSDIITKQSLKALVFLQGLKYDYDSMVSIQEAKDAEEGESTDN